MWLDAPPQGFLQLVQGALFDTGHIAARDPILLRQFPLGARRFSAKAIALTNDVRLPLGQALVHQLTYPDMALAGIQIIQHRILHTNHVHQKQVIAVLISLQRLGKGNLSL